MYRLIDIHSGVKLDEIPYRPEKYEILKFGVLEGMVIAYAGYNIFVDTQLWKEMILYM